MIFTTDQILTIGFFIISAFGTIGLYILNGIHGEMKDLKSSVKDVALNVKELGINQTDLSLRILKVETIQNLCTTCPKE